MALTKFRKRIIPDMYCTAIEFMYAKNPLILKLMKRLDLRAQVGVNDHIDHKELEQLIISSKKQLKISDMGATTKENVNNLYLRPYDGALRKWVKEATASSKQRTTSTGKTVNEELFSSAKGKIKKIYTYEKEIGDAMVNQLVIYLKEDTDKESTVLEMNFNSGFALSFLTRLENIDLRKDVILKPYTIKNEEKSKEKGKDIYNDFLVPYQLNAEGKEAKVEAFWTAKNPGDLPPMQETKSKKSGGKSVWNSVERDEFLVDFVNGINEKIKTISDSEKREERNVATNEEAAALATESMGDDLPF